MPDASAPSVRVDAALADRIDALLPQTQCTKCGYPSCRAYAAALATHAAAINQCPPGGDAGIRRLAAALGREYLPLDPQHGAEQPRHVAVIDEPRCIGCTLCIQACPVDAIVGAPKQMHTVVVELCSGCDLCLPPCPVDCITMVPAVGADAVWDQPRMDAARSRFERRSRRLARDRTERAARLAEPLRTVQGTPDRVPVDPPTDKQAVIRAAVARARAKRAAARDASGERKATAPRPRTVPPRRP
jgi:electron transport complex protein RnfB